MLQAGQVTLDEFKVMLVYHCLGLRYKGELNDDALCGLGQLLELTEPFFEQQEGGIRPIIEWPANLIPEVKLALRRFKGPADALADITLRQFVRGLELSEAIRKDDQGQYLVKLFSHFYLRISPRGKVQKHSEDIAQKNELYLERLPKAVLYGFYFFFKSAVNYLTSQEIHLADGRTYDFSPLFKGEEGSGRSIGPSRVLFALSENKVFGDIETTGDRNLIECLIYMLDKHYEAEDLREKYRNDKPK